MSEKNNITPQDIERLNKVLKMVIEYGQLVEIPNIQQHVMTELFVYVAEYPERLVTMSDDALTTLFNSVLVEFSSYEFSEKFKKTHPKNRQKLIENSVETSFGQALHSTIKSANWN